VNVVVPVATEAPTSTGHPVLMPPSSIESAKMRCFFAVIASTNSERVARSMAGVPVTP
jgi:hypothetical protein